jgi:YidC/Oxa1 family membrane protein insertase
MASGSSIAKIVVPFVLAGLVALVGFTVLKSTASAPSAAKPTTPAAAPAGTPAAPNAPSAPSGAAPAAPAAVTPATPADGAAAATPAATPATPAATTTPAAAPTPAPVATPAAAIAPITGLAARTWPGYTPEKLGALLSADKAASGGNAAPASPAASELQVEFNAIGAGIAKLSLARHFDSISKEKNNEVLQATLARSVPLSDGTTRDYKLVPMGALGVTVNGAYVPLTGTEAAPVWRQEAAGKFIAILADGTGRDVLKLTRTYELVPGTYSVKVLQQAQNLTDQPISVAWRQGGAMDIPTTKVGYGGDVRRVRLGTIPGPSSNPDGQFVAGTDFIPHDTVVGKPLDALGLSWFDQPPLFPTIKTTERGEKLAWLGVANRYFAAAVYSLPDLQPKRADGKPDKELKLTAAVERVALAREFDPYGNATLGDEHAMTREAALLMVLQGAATTVAPGGTADFSVGLYAGPVSKAAIAGDKAAEAAGMDSVVLYTFGGPCAFCTFQSLTYTLRWYLGLLHDFILFDWALAVIVLVLTVRTILHPVTKWSQTNLQRFGKQMQKLAPKQAALKEKFGDDPKRLREETARLMQEEKINYLQALGCLPMFLQMPVWIALYAMIYFTFELRHEGAFFGVFQLATGGNWGFLGDLAEPDRLIPLGFSFPIPLLSTLMGRIDAINFLPLLLGVVFYFQQKYMTPPSATPMSPEMESQQKIMKVMMVVMFPLMMYNAPAALSLYFVANSTLGIIESRHIRQKFEEEEKLREEQEKILGPAARRKLAEQPAGQGFFARMQEALQKRMEAAEKIRQEQEKLRRRGK